MPHDLDFLQLALEQPALGTLDGCDYVRIDAIWCLPHDGAAPRFYAPAHLWEQTPAGRAIGRERYIADLEHALAERDTKILALAQQLAHRAATPDRAEPAPEVSATPEPAPEPVATPEPVTALPCPLCAVTMPSRRALASHMQRAHKQSLITYERQLARPAEPAPDAPPMRAVAAMQAAPSTTEAATSRDRVSCPECGKTYRSKQSLYSHCAIQHPQLITFPEPPELPELTELPARHWTCTHCGSDAFAPSVGDASCCMRCAMAPAAAA